MRVVCCCDGEGSAELVRAALGRLAPIDRLVLLHCIDSGPEHDVHLLQEGRWGRHQPDRDRDAAMARAEEERAVEVLREAAAAARGAGYTGEAEARVRRGRPEREIVRALTELAADVVVLAPRPSARQGPPGPHSLGHVARFVVDHAPCAVLLLRDLSS